MGDKQRLIHSISIRSSTPYQKWQGFVTEVYKYIHKHGYPNITAELPLNHNATAQTSQRFHAPHKCGRELVPERRRGETLHSPPDRQAEDKCDATPLSWMRGHFNGAVTSGTVELGSPRKDGKSLSISPQCQILNGPFRGILQRPIRLVRVSSISCGINICSIVGKTTVCFVRTQLPARPCHGSTLPDIQKACALISCCPADRQENSHP